MTRVRSFYGSIFRPCVEEMSVHHPDLRLIYLRYVDKKHSSNCITFPVIKYVVQTIPPQMYENINNFQSHEMHIFKHPARKLKLKWNFTFCILTPDHLHIYNTISYPVFYHTWLNLWVFSPKTQNSALYVNTYGRDKWSGVHMPARCTYVYTQTWQDAITLIYLYITIEAQHNEMLANYIQVWCTTLEKHSHPFYCQS